MANKVRYSLGGKNNFVKDQVSESTDAEDLRSVNSTDRKPNKEFKKGRKKE